MPRRCANWLASYEEYTKISEAPQEYHLWVAMALISAALQRNVYRDRKRFITWPNIFVFLVGPPGTKKSSAIGIGEKVFRQVQDAPHVVDTFHTAPFLVTALLQASTKYSPAKIPFFIVADEAPAFFRRAKYAEDLIPLLIRMYDCKSGGAGGTQLRGLEDLVDPYAVGLFGVVPDILVDIMPPEVIRGGFASRVIWVYSEDCSRCIPLPEELPPLDPKLEADLVADLTTISMLRGEMHLTSACKKLYSDWYIKHRTTVVPATDDPKRIGYSNRKGEMIFKCMMLASVAESDSLIVEARHFEFAKLIIENLEPSLPKVYQATTRKGMEMAVVDRVYEYILKQGGDVSLHDLSDHNYNNGIFLKEQTDALAQLVARGVVKSYFKGNDEWIKVQKSISSSPP